MAAQIDLAPTPIARLIKQTLPPISSNPHSPDNYRVSKELKAALQRAGGLFALYLAHTAHTVSRETGRQQVTPEDVLGALEELDMEVLVAPTNDFVRAYRRTHLHRQADEDLRPTRVSGSGGSSGGSKKASGGGGSSKRKSGGSGKSKKSGGSKKVKASVDLTADADISAVDQEAGEEEGDSEELQQNALLDAVAPTND